MNRAIVWIEMTIAGLGQGDRGSGGLDRLATMFWQLDALEAAGVLSASDAEPWKQRAREALTVSGADEASPELRAAARAELERALDRLAAGADPNGSMFRGAAWTARVIGLITAAEEHAWMRRHGDHLVAHPPVVDAVTPPRQQAFQARLGEAMGFDPGDRERVITGPPQRIDGVRITVPELHALAIVVRWHEVAADHARTLGYEFTDLDWALEPDSAPALVVRDDSGRTHRFVRPVGGSAQGVDTATGIRVVSWGGAICEGRLAEGAQSLEVALAGGAWTVSLGANGSA